MFSVNKTNTIIDNIQIRLLNDVKDIDPNRLCY